MEWLIFIVVLLAAGVVYVYWLCEPGTIYNSKRPKGYIILNTITEIPCFDGRTFRSVRQAARARDRLVATLTWGPFPTDKIFEIRKVL